MKENSPAQGRTIVPSGPSSCTARRVSSPSRATTVVLRPKRDVGVGLDPFDQVARHVLSQIRTPDDQRDRAPALAQKDGRLAGRVATSDDHDGRGAAHACLHFGGGVVHPVAFEVAQS